MSNINKEELMRGLSDSQVNKSKQDFGTNALAKKETESLWSMFIGAFDDIWIKVLCAALVMKIVISVIGVFVPAATTSSFRLEVSFLSSSSLSSVIGDASELGKINKALTDDNEEDGCNHIPFTGGHY